VLTAQQLGLPSELGGKPFFVTKTWTIGGEGDWNRLTLDPAAGWLYIAHGPVVQVVDVETGALAGQIGGLGEAYAIALDDTGEFGYISDLKAGAILIFDRRSLQISAKIPVASAPRQLVYDPADHLLFAILTPPPIKGATSKTVFHTVNGHLVPGPAPDLNPITPVAMIDTKTNTVLGQMLFSGRLGDALFDGQDRLFVSVVDRNYVLRIDTHHVASLLQSQNGADPTTLDWSEIKASEKARAAWAAPDHPDKIFLNSGCFEPVGLAVDTRQQRLFAVCKNMKLIVWNLGQDKLVATLPLNDAPDSLVYDPDRGLLFVASGAGSGSLTIARRHITDSYTVLQDLPTRTFARSMAVNPVNGEVYLVTNLVGFDLTKPGGIGKLQTAPILGSFQVMVVGD
jgi:DNA-binding beta-propeller fold protein YncE